MSSINSGIIETIISSSFSANDKSDETVISSVIVKVGILNFKTESDYA